MQGLAEGFSPEGAVQRASRLWLEIDSPSNPCLAFPLGAGAEGLPGGPASQPNEVEKEGVGSAGDHTQRKEDDEGRGRQDHMGEVVASVVTDVPRARGSLPQGGALPAFLGGAG